MKVYSGVGRANYTTVVRQARQSGCYDIFPTTYFVYLNAIFRVILIITITIIVIIRGNLKYIGDGAPGIILLPVHITCVTVIIAKLHIINDKQRVIFD